MIKRKNLKKLPKISVSKIVRSPIQNINIKAPLVKQNINNDQNAKTNSISMNSKNNNRKKDETFRVTEKKTEVKQSSKFRNKITVNKNKQKNRLFEKGKNRYVTRTCVSGKIGNNINNALSPDSFSKNYIMRKFLQSIEDVKKRSSVITKRDNIVFKNKHQILRNKTNEYNSFINKNKLVSLDNNNVETIFKYFPRDLELSVDTWKKPKNVPYKTTYDLVHTVLHQENNKFQEPPKYCGLYTTNQSIYSPIFRKHGSIHCSTPLKTFRYDDNLKSKNACLSPKHSIVNTGVGVKRTAISEMPKLTYESHCYQVNHLEKYSSHQTKINSKKHRFITKNTIDKFNFGQNYVKTFYNHKLKAFGNVRGKESDKTAMLSKLCYTKHNVAVSSYTIEFSSIGDYLNRKDTTENNISSNIERSLKSQHNLTYIIPKNFKNTSCEIIDNTFKNIEKMCYKEKASYCMYDSEIYSIFHPINSPLNVNNEKAINQKSNISFISNSQDNKDKNSSKTNIEDNIDPLEVCDTMITNISTISKLYNSFTDTYLSKLFLNDTNKFKIAEDNSNKKHFKTITPVHSQHFITNLEHHSNNINEIKNVGKNCDEINNKANKWDVVENNLNFIEDNKVSVSDDPIIEFDIKDRHRFFPKGK